MIRTVLAGLITLVSILSLGTPLLAYALFSGNTNPLYQVGLACARAVLWVAGVKLEVHGREKTPVGRAVVFMPNHQSNCDPPVIFVLVPPVLVLAKKEFFRIPILGQAMKLRGFIPVNRQNRQEALAAVEAAVESLKAGHSFLVYPEGTRSPDGRIQPFKKGVFVMAIKAGAPIVPISISGASRIMRKGESTMHPGTVRVTFHDPVPTEGHGLDDRETIMAQVRQAILAGLNEEEWPLEAIPSGR